MTEEVFDIAVIGGGPGGYAAAILGARMKARVVLAEQDKLGGTCLNVGCIPTKALSQCAGLFSQCQEAERFGVIVPQVRLDFRKAVRFKDQAVRQLTGGVEQLLKANKVTVVKGRARFKDANTLIVTCDQGSREIKAKNVIIAAGSAEIAIPGFETDGEDVIGSTQALSLQEVPERLVIIGGGVIGVEFASIYRQLGTSVTLVEMTPRLVPAEDAEVTAYLRQCLEKSGVQVMTEAAADTLLRQDGKVAAVMIRQKDGSTQKVPCDKVLVCVGRKALLEGLGTEGLGLELSRGRLVTNERMQTTVQSIYAIGDVTASEQLAHVAYYEAKVAVTNILGQECRADYRAVPRCIYTTPELASVGLPEEKARELHGELKISRFPFYANGKALIGGHTEGFIKLVATKKNGTILGVSIIGPRATELIAEPVLAVRMGLSTAELADTIHAHPTLSEAIGEVSLAALGLNLHSM